ncbi:AimR family lysis-lysogeny pheromone receptor [Shouchella clausii]|uniref:AimR family lysis-lysogeny pheromone receptor n=1 Tax=Shouchella clausii TaxID=79880 RepID=UPI000BA72E37|nr:AimR family lysis-lysogeny pheromone receptor [Shouchella clausii]MEB5480474.1 AimR family lysis-lysogeny pheromone receptor [Shouchella clausii]PAD13896.1 hypothetical protein CHH74_10315 [Shouchella clausii]
MLEVKEKAGTLLRQKGWANPLLNEARMKELANSDEYSFEEVLLIAKHLMPDEYIPLMNVYAASAKKLQHVRDAFEYAALNEQFDILEILINTHKEDELLWESVRVYQLIYDILTNQIDEEESLQKARNLYATTMNPMVRMRLEFLELAQSFKNQTLRGAKIIENRMRSAFKQTEPCYMKSVLASKYSILIGSVLLYNEGRFEEAENYFLASAVNQSSSDGMLSSCYHGLGQIYLVQNKPGLCIDSYEKSINYAAASTLDHYKISLENEFFPFARNMLGQVFDIENVVSEERVHQYIVRGENQQALSLIADLETQGKSTPFLLFYKGKATKNVDFYLQSMRKFADSGHIYYYGIVERELKNLIKRWF